MRLSQLPETTVDKAKSVFRSVLDRIADGSETYRPIGELDEITAPAAHNTPSRKLLLRAGHNAHNALMRDAVYARRGAAFLRRKALHGRYRGAWGLGFTAGYPDEEES